MRALFLAELQKGADLIRLYSQIPSRTHWRGHSAASFIEHRSFSNNCPRLKNSTKSRTLVSGPVALVSIQPNE